MIIAISSTGPSMDSKLDPRFGRAQGFLIHDTESGGNRYISNEQNLGLPQGAGIQSAMNVAKAGAKVLITGHVGPKAFAALGKGKVDVYLCESGTVGEALEDFRQSRLALAQDADKPGHW